MANLILLRHGESLWNRDNRFTGWTDVGLTEQGVQEARQAGRVLLRNGCQLDLAFTSVLKRAIKTLWYALEEMDLTWLPVHRSWRLNERHYGALQGLNKAETARKHGVEKVQRWRRSYDIRPPSLSPDDERYPGRDRRYASLRPEEIPLSESLQDTVERVIPFWQETIDPMLRERKCVFIVSHGNTLRALIKFLDEISNEEIVGLNIPTGIPLCYELDETRKPIRHYLLDR